MRPAGGVCPRRSPESICVKMKGLSGPSGSVYHPPVGAWRSLVAHLFWVQGVVSSNLAAPTTIIEMGRDHSGACAFSRRQHLARGMDDRLAQSVA